jgi:hypothetical protein
MTSDHDLYARITRAGGLYDLVATGAFATPWSARWLLGSLAQLPLGGATIPAFDEGQLLFVVLLGTIVTLWSLLRVLAPSRQLLLVDTVGRVFFATWMLRAAALGASRATFAFAALEIAWALVQGWALWRWTERTTSAPPRGA